jgi:hypothetical protein
MENDLEDLEENNPSDDENRIDDSDGPEIISIGEIVEVMGETRPYAGVVTSIVNDSECRVKYFEYDTEVQLPLTSINRVPRGFMPKEEITVGFKGQCKYSQDQLFYDIVVQALTEHGAIVLYTQYSNTEEVPLEYIRPLIQKQSKQQKENVLIKIPASLKILPTDTEEVCRFMN